MKALLFTAILAITMILTGCDSGSEEIRVYQLSKPDGSAPTQAPQAPVAPFADSARAPATSVNPSSSMNALPGMEAAAAQIETPEWSVPEAWDELPPTSIRKGNFKTGSAGRTAEITVTAFPGDVGGLEANVNRWRQQIGLDPLPLASLQQNLREIEVDGQTAQYVDLMDPNNAGGIGIRGAIIPRGSHTWFVKMVGDQALLVQQEQDLLFFLSSVNF